MENGFAGILKSCDPPITFPAWKCLTTGLNPGNLGVYSFYVWDKTKNEIHFVSSRDFKAKDLWDYLGLHGYKVAVINVPGTFPPKKINGYMISGHFAFDDKKYTYPSELKDFLIRRFNYKVEFIRDFKTTDKRELIQDAIEIVKTRFEVTKHFISEKNVDFVFTVVFLTDAFEHYFWNELPENGNPIEKLYEALDTELRELMGIVDDMGFNLFLVSDHGMCEKKMEFELNTWLYLKNYLRLKKNVFKKNPMMQILQKLIKKINLNSKIATKLIKFLSPKEIYKIADYFQQKEKLSDVSLFDFIDWDISSAFALGHNCIYVLKKNYEIIEDLVRHLSELKDPKTGNRIFRRIKLRNEAYGENCLGNPPDIILIPDYGYLANSKISKGLNPYDYLMDEWVAVHDYDGIFISYGSDIENNVKSQTRTFHICDVTPTILNLYGLSAQGLDGEPRSEIFKSKG